MGVIDIPFAPGVSQSIVFLCLLSPFLCFHFASLDGPATQVGNMESLSFKIPIPIDYAFSRNPP